MELRQLRYFVTVVEEGGFTRAAARLHLAQPGLSAQIRQLEKELGQPLLDRSHRSVTLTETGRAVLPYARAALAAADAVRQTADAYTGLLRGRVSLGLVSGATGHAFDIASFLADFHDAHPALEIALTEDTSERMQTALLAGELDIALLGPTDEVPPPGLSLQTVIDAPLAVVVAAGDPLLAPADRTSVPLAELRDRALICLPRGTGARAALERACAQAGFRPRVAFEAAAPPVLAQLAARGLGVAVLPAGEDGPAGDGHLRTLAIVRPGIRARIALAWRAAGPASPAARALLDRLREALPTAPAR
ncbi:LysR family transcriptional regulator [Streptosporangium nondiastaticum]|uniref:LysR family transcriptional regulator n=1 Tax=Streptosporangium nondiastaticum TaxID=35764 RepID=A0A9X7PGX0_9ACTN|nr:LysR substrate-binding domain-containing protein [Streptosporangium nondiastaticum]PSJ27401.1 LysR family transcriptional regulator [Streptosporangium nondiastaticum]